MDELDAIHDTVVQGGATKDPDAQRQIHELFAKTVKLEAEQQQSVNSTSVVDGSTPKALKLMADNPDKIVDPCDGNANLDNPEDPCLISAKLANITKFTPQMEDMERRMAILYGLQG